MRLSLGVSVSLALLCSVGLAAQAVHPTVQFAAGLLKSGQVDEALTALKTRVDSDPSDCRALGLIVVGYLQQKDAVRAEPWVGRLRGLPACSATLAVTDKLSADAAKKEALARTLVDVVPSGHLEKIEQAIAAAEKDLGPQPAVRAYVEALKGNFPALDEPGVPQLSKALVDALQRRRTERENAIANLQGAFLADFTFNSRESLDKDVLKLIDSEGYRTGHTYAEALSAKAPPNANMSNARLRFTWYAEQVRRLYEIEPLNKDIIEDLMTMAFLTGSASEIESVATLLQTVSGEVRWLGAFHDSKAKWEVAAPVTLDLKNRILRYGPVALTMGASGQVPKDIRQEWSIPFADIREIAQEDLGFTTIKAGYRSIKLESIGAVINGRFKVPLPSKTSWLGSAYGEVPARAMVREYATQIARMAGVPSARVKLVGEKSGGGFSFMQFLAAGSMALSQATNGTTTSYWSQQLAAANAQKAAERQIGTQGATAWERASRDPILGRALDIDGLSAEIDRLLR